MYRSALPLFLLLIVCLQASAQGKPEFRILPPSGATFAPGQRFDVRLEATGIAGKPQGYTLLVNGQARTQEILSGETFGTFPVMGPDGRAMSDLGGGVTRRNWSISRPGKYELSATLTDADGTRHEARSSIEVIDTRSTGRTARNVILFIGDGMGVAQRTAARMVSQSINGGRMKGLLEMDRLETQGFVMTSSLDALVTDSSPGAACYATGNKAINNTHGVFPDNTGPRMGQATSIGSVGDGIVEYSDEVNAALTDNPRIENITELLRRTRRMSAGIVTTVSVTDSTPSAFASHSFSRYIQGVVADQLWNEGQGLEVIMGAGSRAFLPTGHPMLGAARGRSDGRNLIDKFKESGYSFVSNATELRSLGRVQKILGLFHPTDLTSRYDRMRAAKGDPAGVEAVGQFPDQPDLENMLSKAIEVLSRNPNGFFLLVEGGSIDREYHRMDPHRAVIETLELDRAVGAARKWAESRPAKDTLIVVTADHETAGLALPGVQFGTTYNGRAFPNYQDTDRDGFPDSMSPSQPLAFDFPSRFRPAPGENNHVYPRPRNLAVLNPAAVNPPNASNPPSGGHTAVDVFVGATGAGSELFGGVMDNTEVFFRMLRALGYRHTGREGSATAGRN